MAATTQLTLALGAGPTVVLADAFRHTREDTQLGTATIPIPPQITPGVNYGFYKTVYLDVIIAASPATTILNRTLQIDVTMALGLRLFFKTAASYVQASNANRPADSVGSNAATPAGYAIVTTSPTQYDNTSLSGSTLGRNGAYALLVLAVNADYAKGTITAVLPNLVCSYDEI